MDCIVEGGLKIKLIKMALDLPRDAPVRMITVSFDSLILTGYVVVVTMSQNLKLVAPHYVCRGSDQRHSSGVTFNHPKAPDISPTQHFSSSRQWLQNCFPLRRALRGHAHEQLHASQHHERFCHAHSAVTSQRTAMSKPKPSHSLNMASHPPCCPSTGTRSRRLTATS